MNVIGVLFIVNIFQSYYSLISNLNALFKLLLLTHFNPIIVLFLTHKECTGSLRDNFNPIIVLFLTDHKYDLSANIVFQSYYSLISNYKLNKAL